MPDLFLPPGVRYTCLCCGLCCRSLEVTLTEAERERLSATGGTPVPPRTGSTGGAPPGSGGTGILPVSERLFARLRGARGKQAWRLRPRPDGSCPFLTDDNLCRVHAKLGYAAKPFAGRVFPFQFVVTPVGVFVGCRFDCPAVVRGEGEELGKQRGDIRRLYDEYARTYDPPTEEEPVRFFGRYKLSWRDLLRIEDQLTAFLLMTDLDMPRRLLAGVRLVRQFVGLAVGKCEDAHVGADPNAILASVRGPASSGKAPVASNGHPACRPQPGRLRLLERLLLRLAIAAFVGATPHYYRELPFLRRLGTRLGNLWRRLKMALGVGRVRLPGIERPVRLRDVALVVAASVPLADRNRDGCGRAEALDDASAAMLQRYFVAKVASQQFFGRACFGRSFAQGFESLAMAYAAILWLASAHASDRGHRPEESAPPGRNASASETRTPSLAACDIEYGIRQVDHGYNYLGEMGGVFGRARAALLWHWGTAEKALIGLCGHL
ncbi:MAG: YkgJ family cysteine cluster protein [Planctomycetes bacterium]|nr:YkgJ family cysteine cluster protein [Planctomycetota bacterium]